MAPARYDCALALIKVALVAAVVDAAANPIKLANDLIPPTTLVIALMIWALTNNSSAPNNTLAALAAPSIAVSVLVIGVIMFNTGCSKARNSALTKVINIPKLSLILAASAVLLVYLSIVP